MIKPHIWKRVRTWYCGEQLVASGLRTTIPCAPLFGSGHSPDQAYAEWRELYDACAPSAQPFESGDLVRQGNDRALVVCAYQSGALDVRCLETGKFYGWSADQCELMRKSLPGEFFVIAEAAKKVAVPWWKFWR